MAEAALTPLSEDPVTFSRWLFGVGASDEDWTQRVSEFDAPLLSGMIERARSHWGEYPVVVLPLVASHHIMLQRNLLYTAVTRAKEKVILVGSKAALNTALANDRTKRRYSLLAERLRCDSL